MRKKPTLPPDWLAIAETALNEGEACWEVPAEIDGKPNLPIYQDALRDWVVGAKVLKTSSELEQYGIKDGDVVGYCLNLNIIC